MTLKDQLHKRRILADEEYEVECSLCSELYDVFGSDLIEKLGRDLELSDISLVSDDDDFHREHCPYRNDA